MYKVVENHHGRLLSCCQNPDFPESFRVEYQLNEWVKPVVPKTKLFLFEDFESAGRLAWKLTRSFYSNATILIFPCEARGVEKPPREIASPPLIKCFWEMRNELCSDEYMPTPEGTLWADEILLLPPTDSQLARWRLNHHE